MDRDRASQGWRPDRSTPIAAQRASSSSRRVVLYRLSADAAKADRAEELLAIGGTISVQVLNQFVVVASRKLRMT